MTGQDEGVEIKRIIPGEQTQPHTCPLLPPGGHSRPPHSRAASFRPRTVAIGSTTPSPKTDVTDRAEMTNKDRGRHEALRLSHDFISNNKLDH